MKHVKQLVVAGLALFALAWVGVMSLVGRGAGPAGPMTVKDDGSVIAEVKQIEEKDFDVTLSLSVTDRQKELIGGLQRDSFEVREDGKVVPLTEFITAGQQPIRAVLIIDYSGSMAGAKLQGAKDAGLAFVDLMRDRLDQLGLVFFSSSVDEVQPIQVLDPTVRQRAQQAIQGLFAAGGTQMYQAMEQTLEGLKGVAGRRLLLVLTDGMDDSRSPVQLERIVKKAKEAGMPLYMVGLGGAGDIDTPSMERFARETGGQYLHVPRAEQLKDIYRQIGKSLQNEYVLKYRSPSQQRDGLTRKVRVTVRAGDVGTVADSEYRVEGIVSAGGSSAPAPGETKSEGAPFASVFFPLLLVLGALFGVPYLLQLRGGTLAAPPGAMPVPTPAPASPAPTAGPAPGPIPGPMATPVRPAAVPPGKVPAGDGCPVCGRKAPGVPGQRYCMIDDVTF